MRWCLAELASVAALAGDQEAAASWLGRADARAGEANRFFDPWVELDRAWVAAAAGELTRAIDLATRAADMAGASKQFTFEAVALYDVARLGAPARVRQRLEELAGVLEGRLAALLASSAVALAAQDGAALDRVGAAFQDLGALLLAAEAKAAAARAHRAVGRDASANAAQERAAGLVAACQSARTPALGPATPVSVLTPREREVALLAAANISSREIASRLHLSVRTVDNHLGRIYAKLGVSNRAQLATLLEVRVPR
jgi:DNA-binding CsgD family transcriptional regulator